MKRTVETLDALFLTEELSKYFTVKLIYVDMCEDLVAGIVLGQIAQNYVSGNSNTVKVLKDGKLWLVKRRKDWWNECRITSKQVDRALKILQEKGFVEVKRFKFEGTPTSHIRLTTKFAEEINQLLVNFYKKSVQEEQNASSN